MAGQDMPQDPMTAMGEASNQMHELYRSYVDAGFSDAQAMQIICTLIAEAIRAGNAGLS